MLKLTRNIEDTYEGNFKIILRDTKGDLTKCKYVSCIERKMQYYKNVNFPQINS